MRTLLRRVAGGRSWAAASRRCVDVRQLRQARLYRPLSSSSQSAWTGEQTYESRWKSAGGAGAAALLAAAAATAAVSAAGAQTGLHAETSEASASASSPEPGKNIYTRAQVAAHNSPETGIWVTYERGVYDITEFIEQHPGGKRILQAAGSAVDPFWRMYQQHLTPEVLAQLDALRIGTLDDSEENIVLDESDPYAHEPKRHPALTVHKTKPFNAEAPLLSLADNYLTPNELWYVRHHHPVPVVDPEQFRLGVTSDVDACASLKMELRLSDLREKYTHHKVIATMQCGGNRRAQMSKVEKCQGLAWSCGAISTAEWGGVRLRDVLARAGIATLEDADRLGIKHVHFVPLDPPYDASIPIEKALDPRGDVLIALDMNGVEVPPEHGYPVRIIVPGCIGARQVKWCNSIILSGEEAHSTWQRGVQYKGFSPNIKKFDDSVDPSQVLSVQEMPIQSAIVDPVPGFADDLTTDDTEIDLQGYAWSGGGRSIVRVDVSADGGKTWTTAELGAGADQQPGRAWAWTLWKASVPLPTGLKAGDSVELVCKAVDSSYNQQPENVSSLWNLRGILNNSWHRVRVNVVDEE